MPECSKLYLDNMAFPDDAIKIECMYFTRLPDPSEPGFSEEQHFSRFKKHNIIFNAWSNGSHCDDHIGCLSLKTVLNGEEWYTVNKRSVAVRPGQFLVLNDDQRYSCRIQNGEPARVLSIFFRKEFASSVFRDSLISEEASMENPFHPGSGAVEFFQTLHTTGPQLLRRLFDLTAHLDSLGGDTGLTDEHLIFLLQHLIQTHQSEARYSSRVGAIKASTQKEIFKRLCLAKDMLHSSYMEKLDLQTISEAACLSVPQLVRQFKSVFRVTPHYYLTRIRLQHAAESLRHTALTVKEIGWRCGFEDSSAFCRVFKKEYGIQPERFRRSIEELL